MKNFILVCAVALFGLTGARLLAEALAPSRHLPVTQANSFLQVVTNDFNRWDLNKDGVLSAEELNAAVANVNITNREAAAIAALKRATRITKLKLPPLTLESITALSQNRNNAEPDFARMFHEGEVRLKTSTNRVLFPEGSPRLDTIKQGKLGNCFTLAPLGALLNSDPQKVRTMFTAETNGNYAVKLGKQMVHVAAPTDAELAMTSANERAGLWINIYEKAMGEAQNEKRPVEERLGSPLDALAHGGSAGTMLAFITGHEITRFSFKFAKDTNLPPAEFTNKLGQLRTELSAATSAGQLMTCGTLKTTTPDLHPGHAYAVLRYDQPRDSVVLWNPHGQNFTVEGEPGLKNGYPTTNGIFSIPIPDFVKQFSGMAFEVAEATPKP